MGENTGISWAHCTFNPWWGCVEVSPACDNCYAKTWAARMGHDVWGAHATYREFGDAHWNEPLRWNRRAAKDGVRYRVFCASMADVFDKRAPKGAMARLWALIKATPNLDWMLLTKRPQNIARALPEDWGDGYPNVWLGITVEDQTELDRRAPWLLKVPAALYWLSMEPLLAPVTFRWRVWARSRDPERYNHLDGLRPFGWMIVGGESAGHGQTPRPLPMEAVRTLRDEAAEAGVPFHLKQLSQADTKDFGEFEGFPVDLQIRELPRVAA